MTSALDVEKFLATHLDFFESHSHLLEKLQVPHSSGISTVSLVEKQVKVLRERQNENRERLAKFISVARENDLLTEKIQKLTIRLLSVKTLADTVQQIETSMRDDFDIKLIRFLLPELSLQIFSPLLSSGIPHCGQISANQREFLFGSESLEIGSLVLIPVGESCSRGLLALASADTARFNPGMSTEFLTRISEMIAATLARCGVEPLA